MEKYTKDACKGRIIIIIIRGQAPIVSVGVPITDSSAV